MATFLAYMAGLAANLVVSILAARLLGDRKVGLLVLAMVGPNILALLGTLGLPAAVSHFLQRRTIPPRQIVGWSLAVSLASGLVLMLLYLVALPHLRGAVGVDLPLRLAALASAVIPLEILIRVNMAVCQGYQKFNRRSAVLLSYRWLYALLAAALVMLWTREPETIVLASVIAYALANFAGLAVVAKLLGGDSSQRAELSESGDQPAPGPLRTLLGYGWRVHVSTVLTLLVLRADLFLVSRLLGDEAAVGHYSRGVQVAEVVLYFLLAVENVLFPHLSSLAKEEIPEAAATLCRRGLVAGLAMVVLFELASRWLILVPFGQEFAPAIVPLRILLPGVLAIGFARMLFAVFNAQRRPWIPAGIAGGTLLVITALDLWLIPLWGLRGAALASLVGYVLAAAAAVALFAATNRCCPSKFLIPRRSDLEALCSLLPGR
ncbi:MAG: oligosaccharide flippase family protein, partial [Anaerolineaceae bacterium]|nr:oligosaccharide flippase family protein [Anaerolineaceae bacterium]